ncbi:hypothetical protein OROGR_029478 [Orobanche gracilis]
MGGVAMAAEHNKDIRSKGEKWAETCITKNLVYLWRIIPQAVCGEYFITFTIIGGIMARKGSPARPIVLKSIPLNTYDASEVQESIHSPIENSVVFEDVTFHVLYEENVSNCHQGKTKSTFPSPPPKNSMKSRIKSLITEEMSKRKGRHRRSTSYPTRAPLDRTLSIHHHLESSCNSNKHISGCHDSVRSNYPKVGEQNGSKIGTCELCATMLKLNYLKQNKVNELTQLPVQDDTLLWENNLIYLIEQTEGDSIQESKLFMDALDLLNLRKEVFLKILQDPSSSLAHQLHHRRAPNMRFGLSKSVSFPVSSLSGGSYFVDDSNTTGKDNKNLSTELETSDNALKRRDNNKVVLKRFKNLREKIKHVIRDRKKEKNRIFMDAVHHKLPYGHSYNNKEDKFSNYSSRKLYKRTSSFDESYDRYNQLINCLNKEVDHTFDPVRFKTADNNACSPFQRRPAVFKRVLSLPDLRSYSSIQIDYSSNASSLQMTDSVSTRGQKQFDIGLESNKVQPHAVSESASQENLFDVGSTFDDSVDSKTWETASSHDLNIEAVLSSYHQRLDPDRISEDELDYREDEIGRVSVSKGPDSIRPTEDGPSSTQHDSTNSNSASENIAVIDTLESQAIKKLYDDLSRFRVGTKTEAEFNYVKDILDLSGFTRDELLGKWHTAEHPVDPSVFDEVEEGCLVSQPECSGNDEGGTCDHLLLFDLINEVLLDIHERSFYYWPVPLTARSRIHQMPKGYRVLEEVWAEISWLLGWRPEIDQSIDDGVSRDLGRHDRWMNLQTDAEFVGIEVEDLIFDDLLEEIVST